MEDIIQKAIKAREYAYAPYSKIKIGVAVETKTGKIFTGSNIENASYGLTICAERVAIFKAVSEGERKFRRLAIASKDGFPPCGACRQVIYEFAKDLPIILINEKREVKETNIKELLPEGFKL